MLNYDNDARRQFAREHTERLADDMRRTRPLTLNGVAYSGRSGIGALLRRAARYRQAEEPELRISAHDTSIGPT